MYRKAIPLFLIFILITSCNQHSKKESTDIQDVLNETPEVLEENSSYKSGSFTGRYDSDIISKLYDEAMEKNSNLEKLNDEISEMSELENDSLSEYSKYTSINSRYYTSARAYTNRIQDTLIKQEMLENINSFESAHERTMNDYAQKQSIINKKSISLDDHLILMKLFISGSMISNYQTNEKPDIKNLETIIKKYDSLIEATKAYTKINK